ETITISLQSSLQRWSKTLSHITYQLGTHFLQQRGGSIFPVIATGERGSKVVELNDEALEAVYGGQISTVPLLGSIVPNIMLGSVLGSIVPNITLGSVAPSIVLPSISLGR
ncbi:MAG: hypothetical protein ABI234_15810, partial [Ktedonobacteraceae bacterium]